MANYLKQLENPQINHVVFFEVMRDFRKGGLNPSNFAQVIELVEKLPPINMRTDKDYQALIALGLKDVSQNDFPAIMREVFRRIIENAKKCWHPEAGNTTCNIDNSGKIISSAAHSIQNNGVLSQIAENGHVLGYSLEDGRLTTKLFGKNHASIFWGFCNKHDAIFRPIETAPYTKTDEQNFLFAYRGYIVATHKKYEVSQIFDFGEQSNNDIKENVKLFDKAILTKDYSSIKTTVIELPQFYPIAVSSSFYLDFDFEGNPIPHSEERMENIYITLLPNINKTYFLLSHFAVDDHLYGKLGAQLIARNNLKSDLSVLIAGHTENIYFNPTYYNKYIKGQEGKIEKLSFETQFDFARIDENDKAVDPVSITPPDYLSNKYKISLFGF